MRQVTRVFHKNYAPIRTSKAQILDFILTIEVGFLDSGATKYGPWDAQNHLRQFTRVFHKNYAPIRTSKAQFTDFKLNIEVGFLDSGTTKYGP